MLPRAAKDWAFCRWLTIEYGVGCIPMTAFYDPESKHLATNLVRFSFCKSDAALATAAERLLGFKDRVPRTGAPPPS